MSEAEVGGVHDAAADEEYRIVHHVVFPVDGDTDVLPLYLDFNPIQRVVRLSKRSVRRGAISNPTANSSSAHQHSDTVTGRHSIKVPAYKRVSLGTYFNAFPATYWRNHTDVETVRLTVSVDAEATIVVYRSSPRGTANRVDSQHLDGAGTHHFDLPLRPFVDGGWYWFDIVAHAADVALAEGSWSVPQRHALRKGSLSIGVTTFNRADFALRHINTLAGDPAVSKVLDKFILVDQGTSKVRDEAGFSEAASSIGDKFTLIEQGNIGGSGGFSRSMMEAVSAGVSDYVMLLDDDVSIETEGIIRAVNFADFTSRPTIVGGHMFNLYERSVLHTFGEQIDETRYFWRSALNTKEAHDFSAGNLRVTPWLHRRVDVDFNGWWMCMIPTDIIREVGLALPVFIKWDDAEYGIRAREHGYSTVTLPGAAVWHMPWSEKDDTIDWQAYYHQRNRWVATLAHSPVTKGGRMPFESLAVDVRHLLSMQYSVVEVRLRAMEDVLSGPAHLHASIGDKLAWVRAKRSEFTDAQISQDLQSFPQASRVDGADAEDEPNYVVESLWRAGLGLLRQLRRVPAHKLTRPEVNVPAVEAKWWRLSQLDSALVSSSDGTGASWYRRDRKTFISLLRRSIKTHVKIMSRWDELQHDYKTQLPEYTSQGMWQDTFRAASVKSSDEKAR